jgi:hypothetical protein
VIFTAARVPAADFAAATGWSPEPQGLCRGERCVPAPGALGDDGSLDLAIAAERLGMPLVHDPAAGLWALGPEAHAPVAPAEVPPLTLETRDGASFAFSGLVGRRTIMVAWASW